MALYIAHNSMASNAANNLAGAYRALSKSVRKLSSGLRITAAGDDPAGLAVSELMRANIAALNQGVRNANDAISLLQTADDAMAVIDEKLVRMKELASQSSTGTYTSAQRLVIESEYQAMASEITRIANASDYNGIYLLNGNLSSSTHSGSSLQATGKLLVHFGTGDDSKEDYFYIQLDKATASSLGVGNESAQNAGYSVSTQSAAQNSLDAVDAAIVSKDKIRGKLGALQSRLEGTVANLEGQADNLTSAYSQTVDVDVATEMTEFVRQQIIAQSATAMLAQANVMPRLALQLLGI